MKWLSNTDKYHSAMTNLRVKCNNCDRKSTIPVFVDRQICEKCGFYVYRTPQIKFRYRVKEEMRKIEKKEALVHDRKK